MESICGFFFWKVSLYSWCQEPIIILIITLIVPFSHPGKQEICKAQYMTRELSFGFIPVIDSDFSGDWECLWNGFMSLYLHFYWPEGTCLSMGC